MLALAAVDGIALWVYVALSLLRDILTTSERARFGLVFATSVTTQ